MHSGPPPSTGAAATSNTATQQRRNETSQPTRTAHHSTGEACPKFERVLGESFGFRDALLVEADRARATRWHRERQRAEECVSLHLTRVHRLAAAGCESR